jgi:hypothetical protein
MALFGSKTPETAAPAPPPPSSNPFDRVANSEGRFGGVYPLPGVYPALYVDVLKMIRSRKGEDVFIAEFDILDSEVPNRLKGTRMSWAVNFRHDASPGNVKAFLAAVMAVPQTEVDGKGAQYACSDKNPCHGRLVRLEAVQTKTKTGNDFTLTNWRPLPDEIQAQAAELRKQAGFV